MPGQLVRINILLIVCFTAWFLSACGVAASFPGEQTFLPSPEPTATPTPPSFCTADSIPDFTDYLTWTKVNPKPIRGHELYVDIFVNDLAQEIYLNAQGIFPECAVIVKTHLDSQSSDTINAITVMVKMSPGYDPTHNDWWWGMYDRNGKVAEMKGKVQVCIDCHQPMAAEDYVFSKAVLAATQN